MSEHKALLVGISGVSSSGKTTLARLLRDIFTNTFILHEDDFYKPDGEIPVKNGIADWDCVDSINLPSFENTLKYIRKHGMSPPDFTSKEDKNSVGEVHVDRDVIKDLQWKASRWMFKDVTPICIIDGFLLYSESMKAIRELFDLKLFLRTDYETAKRRRENRSGYVTLDGFWEDPPGYVDDIVWPNYVNDHAFLFEDGNVKGVLKKDEAKKLNLFAMPPGAQGNLTACLQWAYDVLEKELLERYTSK